MSKEFLPRTGATVPMPKVKPPKTENPNEKSKEYYHGQMDLVNEWLQFCRVMAMSPIDNERAASLMVTFMQEKANKITEEAKKI